MAFVTASQARQVAENARETEWSSESFGKRLYLGDYRPEMLWQLEVGYNRRGEEFLADLEAYVRGNVNPEEIESTDHISDEVIAGLAELGTFGIKIPREYGGLGLPITYYNRALMLLGSAHAGLGAMVSAHQSVGAPEPLIQFGSEQLRQAFLPRCAAGAISAFLLTEPDVGSDPARLHATARRTESGDFVLDGVKLWTTNGVLAEVLVVIARVVGSEPGGLTAFVVDADTPGITVRRRNHFMGLKGLENGVTTFTDVHIPAQNVVGQIGHGLKVALSSLNGGRLSIPAMCVAASKWSLSIGRQWANARTQWGKRIGQHSAIAHKLSFMAATTFAQEAVVETAGLLAESGQADIRIEAALAKLWCSQMAWEVADDLVQIRGGRGFETAASLAARGERAVPAEQVLRDLRINRIFEGSSEIMHLLIAREAVDAHLEVAGALIDKDASGAEKVEALKAAGLFYARWLPQLVAGAGDLPTSYAGYGHAAASLRFVERASRRLARSTFYAMARWQGGLEDKQAFLGRVVDIGAELFAITACWVHCEHVDEAKRASAHRLATAFSAQAKARVRELFRRLWANTDAGDERLAADLLDGDFTWAEAGIIDPSEGTGPWIADEAPSMDGRSDARRRYR